MQNDGVIQMFKQMRINLHMTLPRGMIAGVCVFGCVCDCSVCDFADSDSLLGSC